MKTNYISSIFAIFGIMSIMAKTLTATPFTTSAVVTSNVSCNGGSNGSASAIPSGGVYPYTYSWSNGGTDSTDVSLTAGAYTVTVTDNAANTATASAVVLQPGTLTVSASASSMFVCPGSSDGLTSSEAGGTTPYTYSWTPFYFAEYSCNTCQNTTAIPFNDPTIYTITVTDNNGCIASASVGIVIYPFPYTTITGNANPVCSGTPVTLVASGATFYLWSTGATTSSIVVSAIGNSTYSVTGSNAWGCTDTTSYYVDTNCVGNGCNATNAIHLKPHDYCNLASYSTMDSALWFKFVPTDSDNQIVAISAFMGMPLPHVHRLTLYNCSQNIVYDEPMPEENGANELRIDASHLATGSVYYIRIARTPAVSNMPGCNPTPTPIGVCNETMKWSFQLCLRSVPVLIPPDSGSEPPSMSNLYYECRGQIEDMNQIPRYDIKAYTNFAYPAVYCQDSLISFVYSHTDTSRTFIDTFQRVDMALTGANLLPLQRLFKIQEDSSAGYLNYLGFVPNGITNIYGYSRLVYKNIYHNIDEEVYSNAMGTKLYFICEPGSGSSSNPPGNPNDIEITFRGANSVNINADSSLSIVTELGTLTFTKGFAYEDSSGIIVPMHWKAGFIPVNFNTVAFSIGAYNYNEPLIIRVDKGHKPTVYTACVDNLCWSTFVGGTDSRDGAFKDITYDASGNIYVTGWTSSGSFPTTPNVFEVSNPSGGLNAVAAEFSNCNINYIPEDALLWATYYGGTEPAALTYGTSIGLDAASPPNVYITGYTTDGSIVVTKPIYNNILNPHAYAEKISGNQNIFIAEFNPTGSSVIWSTFYGGSGTEQANHLAMDNVNNYLYIVGSGATTSTPNQNETGAYNNTNANNSGLILKFSTNVNNITEGNLLWGTYIGSGTAGDATNLSGCAVDASGNFFTTGSCNETTYTVTAGGYPYGGGSSDAIAAGFTAAANAMFWSTYYGGDGEDIGSAITTDQYGNVYITGTTWSPDPTYDIEKNQLPGAYWQPSNGMGPGGHPNGFIAEFNPITPSLVWGTYFGGNYNIYSYALTIDMNEYLYITGAADYNTNISKYGLPAPNTQPPWAYVSFSFSLSAGGATFLAAFNSGNFLWSTYLGNEGDGYGITDFEGSAIYIVGKSNTPSNNFVFVEPPQYPNYGYFQDNMGVANTIPVISEFNISSNITGIRNNINVDKGINVYPNPTYNNVTAIITLPLTQKVTYTLYTIFGKEVYTETINEPASEATHQIPMMTLPAGVYILKINTNDIVYNNKIIKIQ